MNSVNMLQTIIGFGIIMKTNVCLNMLKGDFHLKWLIDGTFAEFKFPCNALII